MQRTSIYRGHWSNVIKTIISNIYAIIIFLFVFFKHSEKSRIGLYSVILAVIIILQAFLKWRSEYFYIEDNMFVYVKGIFSKSNESIPLNKITAVDIELNLIDRIFNAVTLKINSGNATTNEAEFKMIIKNVAAIEIKKLILNESIKVDIKETKTPILDDKKEKENIEIYHKEEGFKAKPRDIIIYALTKGKFGWMLVLWVGLDKVKDIFKKDLLNDMENYKGVMKKFFLDGNMISLILKISIIIIIVYIFSTIISIILELIRYKDFKIYRTNNNINVKYGLINLKEYSIPIEKIQALKFKQNIIQQLFNLYKIEVVVIGQDAKSSLLFPSANIKLKNEIINGIIPKYFFNSPINKAPKKSLSNFMVKRSIITLIVSIIIICVFDIISKKINISIMYKSIIMLVLLISQVIFGFINYKNNGISIEKDLILLTQGTIIKKTYIIKKRKIQSLNIEQSIFQKRKQICNYDIDIATNLMEESITIKNMEINKFIDMLAL